MGGNGSGQAGVSTQASAPVSNPSATVTQAPSTTGGTSFTPVQGSGGAPAGDWMANAASSGGSTATTGGAAGGMSGASTGNLVSAGIMGLADVFKVAPNAVPRYTDVIPRTVNYEVPMLNYGGRRG